VTQRETLDAIRALGLKARFDHANREWRVWPSIEGFPDAEEAAAYYTDDAEDALYTAQAMAKTYT
jgi:hypothetical protein